MRRGRALPVEASDFASKSALFLPKEAQYAYLLNLPDDIAGAELYDAEGAPISSAPHPAQLFFCAVPFAVSEGDIMRSGDAE